jgi:predicted dehydrogenase
MREAPNVAFTAVADVYQSNAERAREWAGTDAKQFQDFRRLLELKDLDAVLVATPDHWHATACVLACAAGKDVYVEKPTSLTVREGRAMVTAARRHNRIVQVGTQHRSAPHFRKIAEMIQGGEIGKVNFVRVWNSVNLTPDGIGRKPVQDPPAGLNWDMYLGPSPKVAFNPNRFLGTFRYFTDYSGGYITDFGNHRLDTVQQIMGVTAPRTVSASGGRFVLQDDGNVPDFLSVTYEYDGFIVTYEGSNLNGHGMGGRTPGHRYYNSRGEWDQPNGIAFYGTEATIFAERIGWELFPEPETPRRKPQRPLKRQWENNEEPTKAHAANFVECVRSRKPPNADIEIGHRSTSMCLLGNIAYKTGKKLHWDAQKEDFAGAPDASALLTRTLRKPWDLIRLG